ncbi:MAG: hypothetical protein IKO56_04635 [Alphaproteobacteria bacterium]|nr:hypothetical protein [Alphaproteobacteria bacterium]
MKIKRYELNENINLKNLFQCGAKENDNVLLKCRFYIDKYITVKHSDIRIRLTFNDDLTKWDDENNVSVVNTDAGLIYAPFYEYIHKNENITNAKIKDFAQQYNDYMDSLPFLKQK